MAIKPILFNTEMVRAILDGRKTCTRRILKGAIPFDEKAEYWNVLKKGEWSGPICVEFIKQGSPYKPGDILYVRETVYQKMGGHYTIDGDWEEVKYSGFRYAATDVRPEENEEFFWKTRPSIHMPKEAARIWLKVTDMRVERLQEITEDGAKAEGANFKNGKNVGFEEKPNRTAIERFADIWNSTIKKSDLDRYGWYANPWVWAIEFERCEKPE